MLGRRVVLILLVAGSLSACGESISGDPIRRSSDPGAPAAGRCADADSYWRCVYVAAGGDDSADGSPEAPFATLNRARRSIRSFDRPWNGDVAILLREGTHHLARTVTFEPEDSGRSGHNVIVGPASGEQTTIAGGPFVTGWSGPDENGMFVSQSVPKTDFRHLVVNGRRATRARYPNGESYLAIAAWDDPAPVQQCPTKKMGRRMGIADADAELFDQIEPRYRRTMEVTYEGRTSFGIFRIASIGKPDEHGSGIRYLIPREPERSRIFGRPFGCMNQEDGLAYRFENSIGLLDEPGEWFLDTTRGQRALYYKPRKGETLTDDAVIAPTLGTLIRFRGRPRHPVHDIQVTGLVLTATTWTRPNEKGVNAPYPGADVRDDSGWWDTRLHPAAIRLDRTRSITIQGNVLQALGGAGIDLHDHTRSTRINGNAVMEIAGIGIIVDGEGFVGRYTTDGELAAPRPGHPHSVGDHITNNRIQRVGMDYWASSAITAAYPWRMLIAHNEVSDGPAMGISLGWYGRWPRCHSLKGPYEKPLPRSTCERAGGRNRIIANRVFGVAKLIDDVGGIYTIGHQSSDRRYVTGVEIRRNHVFGIHGPELGVLPMTPIASMYVDGDSDFDTIIDNIFEKSTGSDPTTLHSIFINLDAKTSVIPHDLRWSDEGATKPPGDNTTRAEDKPDVRDAAGLDSEYAGMPSLDG